MPEDVNVKIEFVRQRVTHLSENLRTIEETVETLRANLKDIEVLLNRINREGTLAMQENKIALQDNRRIIDSNATTIATIQKAWEMRDNQIDTAIRDIRLMDSRQDSLEDEINGLRLEVDDVLRIRIDPFFRWAYGDESRESFFVAWARYVEVVDELKQTVQHLRGYYEALQKREEENRRRRQQLIEALVRFAGTKTFAALFPVVTILFTEWANLVKWEDVVKIVIYILKGGNP